MTSFDQPPLKTAQAHSGLWCLYRLSNDDMEGKRLILTVHLLFRLTSLHKDNNCPWCTMIWMSVHLTHPITHCLSNAAVMCMCEQCAKYNVPFWCPTQTIGPLACVGAGELFSPTTALLVSCSWVCGLRWIICSLHLSWAPPPHFHTCTSHPVSVCICS